LKEEGLEFRILKLLEFEKNGFGIWNFATFGI